MPTDDGHERDRRESPRFPATREPENVLGRDGHAPHRSESTFDVSTSGRVTLDPEEVLVDQTEHARRILEDAGATLDPAAHDLYELVDDRNFTEGTGCLRRTLTI